MCLLITSTCGLPDEEILRLGEKSNPHGNGVAVAYEGKTFWRKGLTIDELINDYKETKLPMLIHFRWASVGEKVPQLAHPFPITEGVELDLRGEAPAIFAHNGHISNWEDILLSSLSGNDKVPDGQFFSDSRIMAYLVWKHGRNVLRFIDPKGKNRFAILNGDGTINHYGTGWTEQKDDTKTVMLSNMNWKNKANNLIGGSSPNYTTPYAYGRRHWEDEYGDGEGWWTYPSRNNIESSSNTNRNANNSNNKQNNTVIVTDNHKQNNTHNHNNNTNKGKHDPWNRWQQHSSNYSDPKPRLDGGYPPGGYNQMTKEEEDYINYVVNGDTKKEDGDTKEKIHSVPLSNDKAM